jgi:RsiW-degrading membrane proteinase PrsW (M82 family)
MEFAFLLKAVMALAPVLAFLVIFDRLDAFDIISTKVIAVLVACGTGIGLVALQFNTFLLVFFPIDISDLSRFGAPPLEEALKAVPLIVLFHLNKLGYKLDAGIAGFAVGSGFAGIENIYFLLSIPDATSTTWLVRGFGTAVMHGGATAAFALVSHTMTGRQTAGSSSSYVFELSYFMPGFLAATLLHAIYNWSTGHPLAIMIFTLIFVPLVLFLIFALDEKVTKNWLKQDSRAHLKMLAAIESGEFFDTKRGKAIRRVVDHSLTATFEDVLQYLTIKTQLVVRAEEALLASQETDTFQVRDEDLERFEELLVLEGRIGVLTLMALEPHLGFSRNDLWELSRLRQRIDKLL